MGNAICMTTAPDTAAATGTPVKLLTYNGVPVDALVAYERAALDLTHDVAQLQTRAVQHLRAVVQQCSTPSKVSSVPANGGAAGAGAFGVSPSLFARVCLHSPILKADPTSHTHGSTIYVDGVPIWLQEVAHQWRAATARGGRGSSSSGSQPATRGGTTAAAVTAPSSASFTRWGAEQQAAWSNGTTQQLREFVSSQKFAKSLLHVRKALKSHGHGLLSSSSTPPLVFAEVMKSYDALAKSLKGNSSSSSVGGAAAHAPPGGLVTSSMWCVVLSRFLRSLPEPLMPPLCSRRLEPLLAHVSDSKARSAAPTQDSFEVSLTACEADVVKVLMDSFVSLRAVDYATFCFVLDVMHEHRAEITGDEVEGVAEALLREAAVPHVVRAVAHACKPEARMFWPVAGKAAKPLPSKEADKNEAPTPPTSTSVKEATSLTPAAVAATVAAAATTTHTQGPGAETPKLAESAAMLRAEDAEGCVNSPTALAAPPSRAATTPAVTRTLDSRREHGGAMAPPSDEDEEDEDSSKSSGVSREDVRAAPAIQKVGARKHQMVNTSTSEESGTESSTSENKHGEKANLAAVPKSKGTLATEGRGGGHMMQWDDSTSFSSSSSSSSGEGAEEREVSKLKTEEEEEKSVSSNSDSFDVFSSEAPVETLIKNTAPAPSSSAKAAEAAPATATPASETSSQLDMLRGLRRESPRHHAAQVPVTSSAQSHQLPMAPDAPPVMPTNAAAVQDAVGAATVPAQLLLPTTRTGHSTALHDAAQNTPLATAALGEAPSLAGVSPVRKADLSLLSRNEREHTLISMHMKGSSSSDGSSSSSISGPEKNTKKSTQISPALLVKQSATDKVREAVDGPKEHSGLHHQDPHLPQLTESDVTLLPSAFLSQAEPTPLRPSHSAAPSVLYPSALEGAAGEVSVAEALRRALQPFSENGSVVPTSGSSPSRSPSLEGLSRPRLHKTPYMGSEGAAGEDETLTPAVTGSAAASATTTAATVLPCPLTQLPSAPNAGLLRTPREELHHQQQQDQRERGHDKTQEAAAQPRPTSYPATAYRAQSARPLQAALLDAKQRFLAAPIHNLPLFAEPASRKTGKDGGVLSSSMRATMHDDSHPNSACTTPAAEDTDAARLRRVLACVEEQGWSSSDLLAALQRAREQSHSVAGAHSTSASPPSGNASAPATASCLSWMPPLVGSADGRVSVQAPPHHSAAGPLSDGHRFSSSLASASLHNLENTKEFRKSSAWSTAAPDEASRRRRTRATQPNRGRLDATGTSLATPSPDDDDDLSSSASGHSSRSSKHYNQTSRSEKRIEQSGPPQRSTPGSSLTTPADTAFTTMLVNASAELPSKGPTATSTALSAMEKELRRLRDVVRGLESSQFAQTRHAEAQTAELAARCAELQRQQQEQARQYRLAQSCLTEVRHELEDMKDDKARLQMQLAMTRQEGAQLRDAVVSGKVRV